MDNPGCHRTTLRGLWRAVNADIEKAVEVSGEFTGLGISLRRKISCLLTPHVACCVIYRLSNWLYYKRLRLLARAFAAVNYALHRVAICPASQIGPGLYIPHTPGVIFYGHSGRNLTLYQHGVVAPSSVCDWRDAVHEGCPSLGNDVTVGVFAMAIGRVRVGDNVMIGPRTMVCEDVPSNCTMIGVNAKTFHPPGRPRA